MMSSWSRVQQTVALSSAEAEYYSMSGGAGEGIFVQSLLAEMGFVTKEVLMKVDASAAKAMAERSSMPTRVKHMQIRFLHLQQLVASKRVRVLKVPGEKNRADLLTKPVTTDVLTRLRGDLGIQVAVIVSQFGGTAAARKKEMDIDESMSELELLKLILTVCAIFVVVFLGGFISRPRAKVSRSTQTNEEEKKLVQSKAVQGPVTYTAVKDKHREGARFQVIGETSWGAWP